MHCHIVGVCMPACFLRAHRTSRHTHKLGTSFSFYFFREGTITKKMKLKSDFFQNILLEFFFLKKKQYVAD